MRTDMRLDHASQGRAQSRWREILPSCTVLMRVAGVSAVALVAANCSQQKASRSIDPKYGVAASPRVVAEGQPIPKGGGRAMVGKPYQVAGRTYVPSAKPNYAAEGLASWYGSAFHGRLTANGEVFDRASIAAAHTTMPLPSYARVTNVQNGRSIIVRVNDRGPFHANRVIDVSERTAEALEFKRAGTARVRVEYVGPASVHGSDDRILMASLRSDGQPAEMPGGSRTMIASNAPAPRPVAAPRKPQPLAVAQAPSFGASGPVLAYAQSAPRPSSAPLPPERPFDLGTIPFAATPISSIGSALGARPVLAGL